jgi:hypothetical protein
VHFVQVFVQFAKNLEHSQLRGAQTHASLTLDVITLRIPAIAFGPLLILIKAKSTIFGAYNFLFHSI